jgi:hypothetical protein
MRAPLVLIPLLLCLAIALYGCGWSRSARAPDGPALALADGPAVGRLAPEIEGQDLDGVRFKLSDYRGKVVVLDFWGNW